MRKLLLAAAFTLALPSVSLAGPCVPAPIATYTALGFSCEIGSATFSDFSLSVLDPTASLIPGIQVAPLAVGLGLSFGVDVTAVGQVYDALIGYTLSGPSVFANTLQMTDPDVAPGGSVTAVEDKCIGGTFAGADPFTPCSGTVLFPPLIVDDIGIIPPNLMDSRAFAAASFFDVFTEITIDGSFAPASLSGTVTNQFSVVPEPSTVLLVGSGLLGVLVRRRRQRVI